MARQTATARNIAAHQKAGLTLDDATTVEAIMADAEQRIAALLDAGDFDTAEQLANDTQAYVLAVFG